LLEDVATDASFLVLEGLDQQVGALLNRPEPAALSPEARAAGPRVADRSIPFGSASDANSGDQVDDVFGDMLPELSGAAPTTTTGVKSNPVLIQQETDPQSLGKAQGEALPPADVQSQLRAIPPHVAALQAAIEKCLQAHFNQRLSSDRDSCWSIMHSFLGWGPACEIHVGGPRGKQTNAIAWVAQNQSCAGRRLFYLEGNLIRGREGPGYQGHPAQFLAMLAQCNVDAGFPLRINDRPFTVADLIEAEKRTCNTGSELTFKLLSLAHYLGTDASWTNDRGEAWDIAKLLSIELAQPVNGAACGGTHRLMAISYAVAKRKLEGGTMDGPWARADKYVQDYHRYTMTLQNRDGSFSSDWFRQRADWGDVDRRVQTTGHILEWLVFSLPDDSLEDPRIVRTVAYLAQTLSHDRYREWEVGPKGHAIRALRLYHERVFQRAQIPIGPLAQREAPVQDR
jgi:hypothetical protein